MTEATCEPWCSRTVRNPARTLSSEVISTGRLVQFGGGGDGASRSKPTTSYERPAIRRITASPIRPLDPVTMMILSSAFTVIAPPSFMYMTWFSGSADRGGPVLYASPSPIPLLR